MKNAMVAFEFALGVTVSHAFVLMRYGKVIAEGVWAPYESLDLDRCVRHWSETHTN